MVVLFFIILSVHTSPDKTNQTVLLCGGPGGGFGGPGGGFRGFLLSSRSSGFATTFTTNGKAAKTTTRTTKTSKNKTKRKTPFSFTSGILLDRLIFHTM